MMSRRWYCVAYLGSDHRSCIHILATSPRHAGESATQSGARPKGQTVKAGRCQIAGQHMPLIRRAAES